MADRSRTASRAGSVRRTTCPITCPITCRRLWAGDADAVHDLFLRLDPAGRAGRFMAAVSDTVAARYGERAPTAEGAAYGAFVDGTLRGLGELRPAGRPTLGFGREAEAAFAVERAFRRAGLGSALFRRVMQAARNRGVADLHLRCLAENRAMLGLAAKLGARAHLHGGEAEATIRLERPTWVSLWSEGMSEALDLTLAVAASPFPAPARRM